jgi:phospholipid/cholesterol/gamma-HCH transport system permease protein
MSATALPVKQPDPARPAAGAAPVERRDPRERLWAGVDQLGGVVQLAFRAIAHWFKPPLFSWLHEAVEQAWILIKRCMIPAGISVFVFGYGPVGVEAGTFLRALGQIDRLGNTYSIGGVREYVPWVTGMVVAGVAGTAITADLGARKVREELEALAVMGVDAVRALVAPRILALMLLLPLLNLVGIVFSTAAGLVVEVNDGGSVSGYLATFGSGFSPVDMGANIVKTLVFGFLIGVICCYRGLNAKGGSEGVGHAVNVAVVQSFAAVWIFNFAFNALYLAAFPGALSIR